MNNNSKNIVTILFVAIMTIVNLYATKMLYIGALITIFEYFLVLRCIFQNKLVDAFVYFIMFTSVTFEMDNFLYFDGVSPILRITFLNGKFFIRFAYLFTIAFIYYRLKLSNKKEENHTVNIIFKWLKFLTISGIISIFIGMIINDNNIIESGAYPTAVIYVLISFFALLLTMYTAVILCKEKENWEKLSNSLVCILAGIAVASIISMLQGYCGYYGYEEIMLAPMVSGFIPCLIMFTRWNDKFTYIYAFLALAVVFLAFNHPSVIGSKWYIVIAMAIVFCVSSFVKIQSSWSFVFFGFIGIMVLPIIVELLMPLMSTNSFNEWKFSQAMGMMDFSSATSFQSWFFNLDTSAKFRVDEPINIAIEYYNKPLFSLFGKGFAGTTLHYTPFCDWDDASAFSDIQVKNGFFYEMHESLAVIMLRHGLVGIVFFITMLVTMIKRIYKTPWSVVGFIWILFYWSYGNSFRLGAVALILAICIPNDLTLKKNE